MLAPTQQAVRLIGGLVTWEGGHKVAPASLREAALPFARVAIEPGVGPVGFLTNLGDQVLYRTDHIWCIGDLDLSNFEELQDLSGSDIADRNALLASLYLREGTQFIRRLQGGFAFALWNRNSENFCLLSTNSGSSACTMSQIPLRQPSRRSRVP